MTKQWEYRVVEIPDGPGDFILAICEVYYRGDKPHSYSEHATPKGQDYTEIQIDLDRMAGALKQPRLRLADFVTGV